MKYFLSTFFIFTFLFMPSYVGAAQIFSTPESGFHLSGGQRIEESVVHQNSPLWFFSYAIDYFFDSGVNPEIIFLILTVPFITFIVAFFRQVIGVNTFGIYTPMLISLFFLLLGIYFGMAVILLVISMSYLLRNVIGKINLLYIPRTSFLLSCTALSFLLVIWFSINFGSPVSIGIAIFPMLVISTISEKISSAQSEEGITAAFRGVVQTLVVAIVAYFFVIWPFISTLIIMYPEVAFIPLALNLLLGKFTGLRLVEYFRFRSLFRDNIEE